MKTYFSRLARLILGLFVSSLGIVMTIKANIGYAPWDVFHAGVANLTGISFGVVTIWVGLIIILIDVLVGEKIGVGSLLNMYLIGVFIDWLLSIHWPLANDFVFGCIELFFGLWTISLGVYLYIGAGFGAGPRDGLMVAVRRKTNLSIGVSRAITEITFALIGWLMGGLLGVGTIISALLISYLIQWTFQIFDFKPTEIRHETLDITLKKLLNKS